MLAITTTSERTSHWIMMHRSFARFSGPEASNRTPSLADFITITYGFRFLVQTSVTICFALNLFFGMTQAPFQNHFLTTLGLKKPSQVD
jgi:hypothetical protein